MPKLIVTEKGTDKKETREFGFEGVVIGRSEENGVNLPSSSVSRKHARIIVNGNNCFLLDLSSGNGTLLNGIRLKPNEETILRHGDTIAIGEFNLSFNNIDEMLASSFNEVTDSDILEVKLLKKVLRAIDKEKIPSLEILNGNFVGKKIFFPDDEMETVIGRDETTDFQVEEYVISRRHAKLTKTGKDITIEDLNSKNGTFVNNGKIVKETLHDGDRIAFGTIVAIFRNPGEIDIGSMRVRKEPSIPVAPSVRQPTAAGPEESDDFSNITEEGDFNEGPSAEQEFSEETPDDYPAPSPKKERIRLSFVEMGLIGVGALISIFALISLVNLIMK